MCNRILIGISLVIFVTGCSEQEQSALTEDAPLTDFESPNQVHRFQLSRSGQLPVAINSGGPKYDTPIFSFVEVISLTPDPSNEDSYLFVPSGLTLDNEGNYYVVDSRNYRIAVFDSDGKYLRSFGRFGQGPGELMNPKIEVINGNVLQIFDQAQRRITRYLTDGTLLDVISIRDGREFPREAIVSPDGNRIVVVNPKRKRSRRYVDTSFQIQFMTIDQHEMESINTPRARQIARGSGNSASQSMYYAPRPQVCFSSQHGIIISTGENPILECYNWYGSHVRTIKFEMPYQPVRVRDQIRIREFIAEAVATASAQDRQRTLSTERIFPEMKAFWHRSQVDDEGYIWLIEYWDFEARDEGLGQTCMVVSPEGELLGKCYLPNTSGRFVRGHYLTIITNKSTGERIPTAFRIESNVVGLDYPN